MAHLARQKADGSRTSQKAILWNLVRGRGIKIGGLDPLRVDAMLCANGDSHTEGCTGNTNGDQLLTTEIPQMRHINCQ